MLKCFRSKLINEQIQRTTTYEVLFRILSCFANFNSQIGVLLEIPTIPNTTLEGLPADLLMPCLLDSCPSLSELTVEAVSAYHLRSAEYTA